MKSDIMGHVNGTARRVNVDRSLTHSSDFSREQDDMQTTSQHWLPIPGYEGRYDVSDRGRVRSWMPYHNLPVPHLLAVVIGNHGYPITTLRDSGSQEQHLVHALVMLAFVGPRLEGMETRHLDGDRQHCDLDNMAYGTSSENNFDLVRHGTHHNASKIQCKWGHPYDEANTLHRRDGGRACRACARRRISDYNKRRNLTNKES